MSTCFMAYFMHIANKRMFDLRLYCVNNDFSLAVRGGCGLARESLLEMYSTVIVCMPMIDNLPTHTRERPPGCKTVFIGGLPENATEEILREMLANCGEICSLRLSKKNFAHIRFTSMESVDKALHFSGQWLDYCWSTVHMFSACLLCVFFPLKSSRPSAVCFRSLSHRLFKALGV